MCKDDMPKDASPAALTTGDLARAAGLTAKAVRLYDERGLLRPRRTPEGWRLFDRDQVDRARLIALLRSLGAPLDVVQELLDAGAGRVAEPRVIPPGPVAPGARSPGALATGAGMPDAGHTDVIRDLARERAAQDDAVALFDRWWTREQSQQAGRTPLAEMVRRRIAGADLPTLAATRRAVPEQLVLTRTVRTDAAGLPDALHTSTRTLFAQLTRDDVAGPLHVVYRGRITPDGDGEIETCVPVVGPVRPGAGTVLRLDPAVALAVVTVPGAPGTAGFARMVEVHDALSAGRFTLDGEAGATPTGDNREITYPPHEEQRTDVAVPIPS